MARRPPPRPPGPDTDAADGRGDPGLHRSADRGSRHPDDAFLRRHGFRIGSRPDCWTAIWLRFGTEYSFLQAMEIATWEQENGLL